MKTAYNKKILLIEDDKRLCEELSEILTDEGYSVDCKHEGLDGRKTLYDKKYDVLILDIKIPVLDGESILKEVREENLCSKVIVITGKPLSKIGEKLDNNLPYPLNQADLVINKPFKISYLLECLAKI